MQFLGLAVNQHHSPMPAAHPAATSIASPTRRPKSAVYRRTEISLSPRRQTAGSTSTQGVTTTTREVPPSRSPKHEGRRCVTSVPAAATEGLATSAAIEATIGRSEYPGSAEYNGRAAVRVGKAQPRVRPRSAVARVETTAHHGAEVRATGFVGRRRVLRFCPDVIRCLIDLETNTRMLFAPSVYALNSGWLCAIIDFTLGEPARV